MSWPLYRGEDIGGLLPQREPFLMVDVLYGCTIAGCCTGYGIRRDDIFCDGMLFSAEGIIEHIAQSGSLLLGYNAVEKGLQAPLGYIGEIKKFSLVQHPRSGQSLSTHVNVDKELDGIYLMSAETMVKNASIAQCRMKLSLVRS